MPEGKALYIKEIYFHSSPFSFFTTERSHLVTIYVAVSEVLSSRVLKFYKQRPPSLEAHYVAISLTARQWCWELYLRMQSETFWLKEGARKRDRHETKQFLGIDRCFIQPESAYLTRSAVSS